MVASIVAIVGTSVLMNINLLRMIRLEKVRRCLEEERRIELEIKLNGLIERLGMLEGDK